MPAALNNFFRVENLAALREVALRQTAEEVESKRFVGGAGELLGTREELLADEAPQALAERVLALITPRPRSQRLVRRAWRSAQRLGAELDLLYVQPPGSPPRGEEREQLEAMRRLASILGAALIVEEGDDLVDTAARVAAERGTTYVLIGQPRPHTGLRRFERVPARPAAPQAAGRGRADRGGPLASRRGGAVSLFSRGGGRRGASGRRILFPFVGSTISHATLESTFRLARAQEATLMPAYLAMVPHHLSLEAAVPVRESEAAVPMLELIEQRAARVGVPVDARIERGRSARHALTTLLENERFDTLVIPAKTSATDGFEAPDVAWVLENAPGEVLVLRPEPSPLSAAERSAPHHRGAS